MRPSDSPKLAKDGTLELCLPVGTFLNFNGKFLFVLKNVLPAFLKRLKEKKRQSNKETYGLYVKIPQLLETLLLNVFSR